MSSRCLSDRPHSGYGATTNDQDNTVRYVKFCPILVESNMLACWFPWARGCLVQCLLFPLMDCYFHEIHEYYIGRFTCVWSSRMQEFSAPIYVPKH